VAAAGGGWRAPRPRARSLPDRHGCAAARDLHQSSGSPQQTGGRRTKMESNVRRPRAVYAVVPKPEGKDVWLRVGSAFENRDGSVSVLLDAVPVGGKLQIRDYQPRDASAAREQPEQARLA
jgi:hypothetical protein